MELREGEGVGLKLASLNHDPLPGWAAQRFREVKMHRLTDISPKKIRELGQGHLPQGLPGFECRGLAKQGSALLDNRAW